MDWPAFCDLFFVVSIVRTSQLLIKRQNNAIYSGNLKDIGI